MSLPSGLACPSASTPSIRAVLHRGAHDYSQKIAATQTSLLQQIHGIGVRSGTKSSREDAESHTFP